MIDKCWTGDVVVRVYWDYEWQEFQVTLSVCGKKFPDSTYHTSDKDDAVSTAQSMMMDAYNRVQKAKLVASGSVVVTDFSLL